MSKASVFFSVVLLLLVTEQANSQIRIYAFAGHEWIKDRKEPAETWNPAISENGQSFFIGVERIRTMVRNQSFEGGIGFVKRTINFYEDKADVSKLEVSSPALYFKTNTYIIDRFLSLSLTVDFYYDKSIKQHAPEYPALSGGVKIGPAIMPVKRLKIFYNYKFSMVAYSGHQVGLGYYFYQIDK